MLGTLDDLTDTDPGLKVAAADGGVEPEGDVSVIDPSPGKLAEETNCWPFSFSALTSRR